MENDLLVRSGTEFVSFTYILFYIHIEYTFYRVVLSSLEDLSLNSFSKLPFQKNLFYSLL